MNDEFRLEVERFFDDELPEAARRGLLDRLAADPAARRHLDHLAGLRELARRHDPAASLPRRGPAAPPRRLPIGRWLALASTAAAVAFFCRPGGPPGDRPGGTPPPAIATAPLSTGPRPSPSGDRAPLEVELYRWANAPGRAPRQAARLVLSPVPTSRRRSPADEILALELANSSPKGRGDVRRFAASKGPKSTPQARPTAPGQRARGVHPTA